MPLLSKDQWRPILDTLTLNVSILLSKTRSKLSPSDLFQMDYFFGINRGGFLFNLSTTNKFDQFSPPLFFIGDNN